MHLASCTNTHHVVKDLVNHEMVENAKAWIPWKQNITFLQNKKSLNLCLRWHILRSYHFAAEVTFKCHTQRMERIDWISRCAEIYAELFQKKIIKITYCRSSLDPENSPCGHQQPYNFFWFLSISGHLQTTQEKQNQSIWRRRISCNRRKKFSIMSKGKISRADWKKSVYC